MIKEREREGKRRYGAKMGEGRDTQSRHKENIKEKVEEW